MRPRRLIALLFFIVNTTALAQTAAPPRPIMPSTGLDFSAIDQFWRLVDVLTRDAEPTDAQWSALLATPGYQHAQMAIGPVVKEDLGFGKVQVQ